MNQAELARQIPDLAGALGCSEEAARFVFQDLVVEAGWAQARSRRSFDYCLGVALKCFKEAVCNGEDILSASNVAAARMDAIVVLQKR